MVRCWGGRYGLSCCRGEPMLVDPKAWADRVHVLTLGVLEFYTTGADVCPETLAKMNRELAEVLPRACREFGITQVPEWTLRAESDGDHVDVYAVPFTLN